MKSRNKSIGDLGEKLAEKFLLGKGFEVLGRKHTIRGGEIDLIVLHAHKVHFVEVKTRVGKRFGGFEQSLGWKKILCLKRAAFDFLQKRPVQACSLQFDLLGIDLSHDLRTAEITWMENVVEL